MPIAVERTVQALVAIVQTVPIGTNLALVRVLWAMLNGSFVRSRGAFFAALWANGFSAQEVRRSWAALRAGAWTINELLDNWGRDVAHDGQWQARRYEGYQGMSVDITGFWRPQLQRWPGKHFHRLMQKSLPAVVLGVLVAVGEVHGRRVPLLRHLVRGQPTQAKPAFRTHLLQQAALQASADQVVVADSEFERAELQAAGVARYVVRLRSNGIARRNQLPPAKGRGRRAKFGEKVRPLARTRRGQEVAATPADAHSDFVLEGRRIAVSAWHDLVLPTTPVAADAATFSLYLFQDPHYRQPLLLATNLRPLQPETVFRLYRDRWSVEQPPLAAKQMVGLHRQFVFAPESCFRLPELSLLAGSVLTYLAAVLPPTPCGFWDRTPQPTPGRLRRLLAQAKFPSLLDHDPPMRKKNSVTAHLPTGIHAHRRRKRAA
jgi:hypothetical protein